MLSDYLFMFGRKVGIPGSIGEIKAGENKIN
jgi:hypothetical protein